MSEIAWRWPHECSPTEPGWYAIGFDFGENEGLHMGADYWDGDNWREMLPVCRYAGPFPDEATAKDWAYDNDPDL
jgi:hypothetical protein